MILHVNHLMADDVPWHEISNNVAFLTNVDSYEPVQPPLKLSNCRWCSVSSLYVTVKRQANALIRLRMCAG